MRSLFTSTIIMLLIIPAAFAVAQFPGVNIAELTITPERPGPDTTVRAEVESYATDINLADITWTIDGQTKASGKGLRVFSFKTAPLGAKTALGVIIVTSEGFPFSKTLTLYPAKVDLLYEASSYTPPFYKGKAYFPYQGRVRVIAVPSFVDEKSVPIPKDNLLFNWKEKDKMVKEASGVGKNIFIFKGQIPMRANTVSVDVSSLDQKYIASANVDLEPTGPATVLYENHPEYGVLYNRALTDPIVLNKEEMRIQAVPYFFDVSDADDSKLKYEWSLNGNPVGRDESSVVLKNSSNSNGRALISLQLSNLVDIFQFSNLSENINFGKNDKNIFGQ